jgi:hypothetical protein
MISRAAVPLSALLLLVASCSGSTEEPPVTVGPVPIASNTDTLLPVLADTLPVDLTVTIAPDTLFGGDPCSALVEADFRKVTFAGAGRGAMTAANMLGEDTCGYDVTAGSQAFVVIVQAATVDDFDHPVTTAQEIDQITGIGDEAIGVRRGDDLYEVIVHVSNGYFSVSTPDEGSARALATVAASRALRG